jgi:hypothetical protein
MAVDYRTLRSVLYLAKEAITRPRTLRPLTLMSPMLSAGGDQKAGSVSSPSAASSSTDHLSFITPGQGNSSASPLCFLTL